MKAWATSLQIAVEEGAGEVGARLDVGRVGAAPQRHRHLVGRLDQRVANDLEADRINRTGRWHGKVLLAAETSYCLQAIS